MMSGNPLSSIGGNTPYGSIAAGIPGVLQGFFGDSGAPYKKAFEAFQPFYNQARGYQNPFYKAGTGAIPGYQNWVDRMSDPTQYINNLMNAYQESPWAKFQQQQAIRSGTNAASASGLIGSTPFAQQLEQNASNISSQDMNQWLQNVLGINTQYGQGLGNEVGFGAHAGDILSQLGLEGGEYAGGTAYGQEAGQQQDRNALLAGIAKMFGG